MLKKYLPLLGFTAAAYAVVYYLRNKAAAGTNLQYLPLDVAIDSQRTAQAGYSRIYYRLKLRLINDEPASVNVRSINLNITVGGNLIGKINNTTGFEVEANSTKDIQLDASFQTVNIISLIQDLIINGFEDPINVAGFIQTDLGRINIQFSKSLAGGITGPRLCAPLLLNDKYFLYWKNHQQPAGFKLAEVYDYMINSINTGAKINEFSIKTESGSTIPGAVFFKQTQFVNFEPKTFRAN
jgi:hypothetical protein